MSSAEAVLVVLAGYVLGCFTAGYYLTRLLTREDVRDQGSGSTGATNVRRRLGWPAAAVTLLLDVAKGLVGIWAVMQLGQGAWWTMLTTLAVVSGHIWPIQLRFRGGKGVAPALGSVLALDPFLALGLSILFFALLPFTKRFVPTGLFVITLSPALALAFGRQGPLVLGLLALAALLLVAHRTNIRDLVPGATTPGQALPRPRRGGLP